MSEPIKIPLGDRMKIFEANAERFVAKENAFIIRLDGHGFSKRTANILQPFDPKFVNTMIKTAEQLLMEFHATTAYCHSDEITLVFPPIDASMISKSTHIYNGRYQKLTTLCAGFASAHFNAIAIQEPLIMDVSYFDARIMEFKPEEFNEITNHMIWRSNNDCYRNCVSKYTDQYIPKKDSSGKNSIERIEMMVAKGFDFDSQVPIHLKYGTYIKRQLVTLILNDIEVQRHQTIKFCLKTKFTVDFIELLLGKTYKPYDNIQVVLI
jgi:tRNA(His) guanylyltransferase